MRRRATWRVAQRAVLIGLPLSFFLFAGPAAAHADSAALSPTGELIFFDRPCRLVDTRQAQGLTPGVEIDLSSAACGVPVGVESIAVNVTVVAPPAPGDVRIAAKGSPFPFPILSFATGVTRANNGIVSVSSSGQVGILVDMPSRPTATVDVLVDVQGYLDAPPVLVSTNPADGATGVGLTNPLIVTFSKPVNATVSSFSLECPTGTPETFDVLPASPATTFSLTTSAPRTAGAVCTLGIRASEVADPADQPLSADATVSFTADVAPTVTITTPTNGATDVALGATVQFTFDREVEATASAFKLECPGGTPVPFALTPAPPGNSRVFTLTPSAKFPAGIVCTATAVATQITDAVGTPLAADDVVSFTTDTAPNVASTIPVAGATSVTPGAGITLTFSKAVNVTATAFTLQCPAGTPAAFTIAPTPPGAVSSFTLTPAPALPQGVTCTVTAVATQITDVSASTDLPSNYAFSFTTGVAPTVVSTAPSNGTTDVPRASTVAITFSQNVTASVGAFALECPVGTPVAFAVSPSLPSSGSSFILTPSASLPAGTLCTATVVASAVADASTALPLAASDVFAFTVDSLPMVTAVTPGEGAADVPHGTTVTVTFSKPVEVTDTAFTLGCPTGTPQTFTVAPAVPGNGMAFTLTPTAELPPTLNQRGMSGVLCTATVLASQVTDAAGSHLPGDFSSSFTTDAPPLLINFQPAVLPPVNPSASFTFNKPVNVTSLAFKVRCPSGDLPSTFSPAPPGNSTQFTLRSTGNQILCNVIVEALAITDSVGTRMAESPFGDVLVYGGLPVPAPNVLATDPAGGAIQVSPSTSVSVLFSQPITAGDTAFDLQCTGVGTVPSTVSPSGDSAFSTLYTLTPSAALPARSICVMTVTAAQITNILGTPMAGDLPVEFTVAP